MSKFLMLVYALIGYVVGLASIAYIIGFLADFGVPKSIGDGEANSTWAAAAIDAGLVGLFGLHHSVTARTSFKRWWTKIIPAPIERATYLYMTAAMTAMLVVLWTLLGSWMVLSRAQEGLQARSARPLLSGERGVPSLQPNGHQRTSTETNLDLDPTTLRSYLECLRSD